MKRVFTLSLLLTLVLIACRKDNTATLVDSYLQNVKVAIRDSLQHNDYAQLDFTKAVLTKVDSVNLYILRIPFRGKSLPTDFVLLQTLVSGRVLEGRIIHLEGGQTEVGEGRVKRRVWNGSITISTLDRKTVLASRVTGGYIEAFHPQAAARTTNLPAPEYVELAEVVVVSQPSNSGSFTFSNWILLQGLFTGGSGYGGYGYGGYYGSLEGGGYGGGGYGGSGSNTGDYSGGYGTGGSGTGESIVLDPPILIDQETHDANDAVDIQKFMNCFDAIADAGATCTMEILTDIPVDGNPSSFFNWQTGSPGHTFIKLKKSNGSQSVQQVIGWYPQSGYKTMLTSAPITGKFVNNELHEYNASLAMNLTPAQLQTAITRVLYLSRFIKYDIDEYNCTDFVLDVFNETVAPAQRLELPKYDIPGGTAPTGTNTPNGLYQKLQSMMAAGSGGIDMPGIKGWVGHSNGPCN
ncbi:MAG: hypothetical protein JWP69_1655 [Flaviaesturariibacter sp.]|nr:hypothetical protein [Flaviaesturariibacter sp.]